MRSYLLLGVIFVLAIACTDDSDSDGQIQIRIENISAYDFQNVFVDTGGGDHTYGTIQSGGTSNYLNYTSAYRYAYVSLFIDGEEFRIQPIDYVGETLLEAGKYTYLINASDSMDFYGRLSMQHRQD